MKILLVEDERDILNGLAGALEAYDPSYTIYCALTGEEALLLVSRHLPDIIVTDIMLPEMSGLDMLEQLREMSGYTPQVMIISGYDQFHYAQRSMQLGAIDYFLKPFAKEAFLDKIARVAAMIRATQTQAQAKLLYSNEAKAYLKEQYVLGLLTSGISLQGQTYHQLNMWELTWLAHTPVTVIVHDAPEEEAPWDTQFAEALQPFIQVRHPLNYTVMLTGAERAHDYWQERSKRQPISFKAGVSRRTDAFEQIAGAFEQALAAYKLAQLGMMPSVVGYEDVEREEAFGEITVEQICESLVLDDMELARRRIAAFLQHGAQEAKAATLDTAALAQLGMRLLSAIHHCLRERFGADVDVPIPISMWEEMEKAASAGGMIDTLAAHCAELSRRLGAASSPTNSVIERAKAIIQAEYAKEMTLQYVADRLEITPFWLSRLFKKEEDVNFSEYVTNVRMEAAKKRLRESNLKIYEISEEVGYKDLQYFCKLFKKKTGHTPKEYKYGR